MDKVYAAVRSLFRFWKSIAVLTVAGALIGAVVPIAADSSYSCEARVTISVTSANTAEALEAAMQFGARQSATLATLPVSVEVLEQVAISLDLPLSTADLNALISIKIPANASAVGIVVTHTDSSLAYEIALATARESASRFAELVPTSDLGEALVAVDYYVGVPAVLSTPTPRWRVLMWGVALGMVAALLQAAFRKGWTDAAARDASGEGFSREARLTDSLLRTSQLLGLAADELATPRAEVPLRDSPGC
jgi:capsular polysaccharide biosynthesis protein